MKNQNKNQLLHNKKGAGQIVLILMILAGVLVVSSLSGFNIASLVGYESVYKANSGHVCCEEGAYEQPYIRYADDIPTYECDAYTDECRIGFQYDDPGFIKDPVCFKVDGGSLQSVTWGSSDKAIIPYGSEITFVDCGVFSKDMRPYYKYVADYRRFYIEGEENGRIYTQTSCILDSDLRQRVAEGGLNELAKTGSNRCQNYFVDFILTASRTYSYAGNEVICQARNLYDVDNIEFLDDSSRKIQGEWIKAVECCPAEANCNDNFEWDAGESTDECTYEYQCANAGEPVSLTGTSYVEWDCVGGVCQQSNPINVECTNNAICVDKLNKPNAVCKNFKCTEDDSWLDHCGDGRCEDAVGETPTSCPQDCGQWDPAPNYLLYIVIFLIIVFLVLFWRQIYAIIKTILAKVGIKL